MAQRVQVHLTDDIDGGDAARTISFAWQGQSYEIDLSDENVDAFQKALQPYLDASRKATSSTRNRRGRAASTTSSSGLNVPQVRDWALANGHQLSARGRVPKAILEAYRNAH